MENVSISSYLLKRYSLEYRISFISEKFVTNQRSILISNGIKRTRKKLGTVNYMCTQIPTEEGKIKRSHRFTEVFVWLQEAEILYQ